jgi:hypothetical protein
MSLWKIAGVSLMLASVGTPQTVSADLLLLSRIKLHMREELSHIPNYTCLETISRFRNNPGSHSQSQRQLAPLDTVRLEIVYSNHREWYGAPGGRNLSVDDPGTFIASGMIGNGAFAATLNNILEAASFTYRGEENLGGRTAVKYDFRLRRLLNAFRISIPGGDGTVGEEGSFWADPQSLDLIRLKSRADEIPPSLPLAEASESVNYARMRIGEDDVLLAQQAELHMLHASGMESYNRLDFTHCHAYSAHSDLRFDPKPDEPPQASIPNTAAGTGQNIPASLLFTVELTTSISDKNSVGTLIEGKVSGDVLRKGKIVIPRGSVVRGRIRRLERSPEGGAFILGLEFTEVDAPGGSLPFYADLLRIEKNPGLQPVFSEQVLVSYRETITLPELPGVASFLVSGTTFTLPRGFRMVWRTRGPIR